jgi:hypothetical protein
MSYTKPETKAEKRAHLRGFVAEYTRLMTPPEDHPDNCQHCVGRADQAYRLAAKIVDLGIDLDLYRPPTPRKRRAQPEAWREWRAL